PGHHRVARHSASLLHGGDDRVEKRLASRVAHGANQGRGGEALARGRDGREEPEDHRQREREATFSCPQRLPSALMAGFRSARVGAYQEDSYPSRSTTPADTRASWVRLTWMRCTPSWRARSAA